MNTLSQTNRMNRIEIKNNLETIKNHYPDEKFLSADGFDEAILGISNKRLVYSISRCIQLLVVKDGMSYNEAVEYFYFNVENRYIQKKRPIWVDDDLLF